MLAYVYEIKLSSTNDFPPKNEGETDEVGQ